MDRHFTIRVDHFFHHVGNSEFESRVMAELQMLREQGEQLMAGQDRLDLSLQDLAAKTDEMAAVTEQVIANDATEDAAFKAEIEALKAQVAAGETLRVEQLDALANSAADRVEARTAALQSVTDALRAAGTDPADPLPPVEPPVDVPPVEEPPVETEPAPPTDTQSRRR